METYTPRVMYHPSGKSRRVETSQTEAALLASEWAFDPYPPPPEPAKSKTLPEQVEELRDRILVLEAVLVRRKPGK